MWENVLEKLTNNQIILVELSIYYALVICWIIQFAFHLLNSPGRK